jgi:hypothetical protein
MSAELIKFSAASVAAQREAKFARWRKECFDLWDSCDPEEYRAAFMAVFKLAGAELCAKVGDGLTGRRRRIVGEFEPPLLQQRSDTPCPMRTSSSCFNQGRSPTR